MTSKIPSPTVNDPEHLEASGLDDVLPVDLAAHWAEARLAYPLYAALATQFNLAPLPYPAGKLPSEQPVHSIESGLEWFDNLDSKVMAFQLRLLPPEILNASEETLRAFARRQLRKPDKADADRDKIDLLLVQYFALCAPAELVRGEITLEDVAQVVRPLLSAADSTPLEWCEPLEEVLEKTKYCQSLRDIMEHSLLEHGRHLKDSAGSNFYDPAALVAFTRFNFLLRRAFIRVLHADLSAIREAVDTLESRGVKAVDCRRAGFTAAETTARLRHFCENWRQPFQKDYTQSSVKQAFEQLLGLRADMEEALQHAPPEAEEIVLLEVSGEDPEAAALEESNTSFMSESPGSVEPVQRIEATAEEEAAASESIEVEFISAEGSQRAGGGSPVGASAEPASPSKSQSEPAAKAAAVAAEIPLLDAPKCLEAIWEQLRAVPASKGRSMSTVIVQDTKVMLSSWEVDAFLNDAGADSGDLRRAVVARAQVSLANDRRKRTGDGSALASALILARTEILYFHDRIEQSKKAKNIEAAVNLGISTKRLVSCIEEAEAPPS